MTENMVGRFTQQEVCATIRALFKKYPIPLDTIKEKTSMPIIDIKEMLLGVDFPISTHVLEAFPPLWGFSSIETMIINTGKVKIEDNANPALTGWLSNKYLDVKTVEPQPEKQGRKEIYQKHAKKLGSKIFEILENNEEQEVPQPLAVNRVLETQPEEKKQLSNNVSVKTNITSEAKEENLKIANEIAVSPKNALQEEISTSYIFGQPKQSESGLKEHHHDNSNPTSAFEVIPELKKENNVTLALSQNEISEDIPESYIYKSSAQRKIENKERDNANILINTTLTSDTEIRHDFNKVLCASGLIKEAKALVEATRYSPHKPKIINITTIGDFQRMKWPQVDAAIKCLGPKKLCTIYKFFCDKGFPPDWILPPNIANAEENTPGFLEKNEHSRIFNAKGSSYRSTY